VDTATFEQILDMDDADEDDAHEFSKSIVFGFLDQADSTFAKMETSKYVRPDKSIHVVRTLIHYVLRKDKDLKELSSLGHFLKGSSATLGFTKVKDECEKIQHYGQKKDETGATDEPDEEKCLRLIGQSIAKAKTAYDEVKRLMEQYYAKLEGNA